MRWVNRHTAAFTLPPRPGFPLGFDLEPGANDVPAVFADAVSNPGVSAWVAGGLLEIESAVAEEPAKEDKPSRRGR